MSEITYDTVLRGFDCVVFDSPENDGYVRVEIYENGRKVYMVDIPLLEGEELNSSDAIDRVSDSAIDLFESQRGTLGQGAGIMSKDSIKKKSCYYPIIRSKEEWFRNIQGTSYEDGAIVILEKLLDLNQDKMDKEQQIEEMGGFCDKLLHDMDKLDLERVKSSNGYKDQVIVIKADKIGCFYSADDVKEYLEMFRGHELEPLAISKMKEYLDVKSQMKEMEDTIDSIYEQQDDIEEQMKEMTVLVAESAISNNVDMEFMKYPNMTNDIAELMDGIELEESVAVTAKKSRNLSGLEDEILQRLVSAGGFIPQEECSYDTEDMGRLQAEMLVRLVNHSGPYEDETRQEFFVYEITPYGEKALETKKSFSLSADKDSDSDTTTDLIVDQLGEAHDGLQPAEVDPDGMPFNEGEKIELTKAVDIALWGGKITYPKGTKGHIDSLYDRHGDYYKVMTDKGKLIKVKWDQMKRTRKNKKK